MWRLRQAVIGQIEVQQLHDFGHVLFDAALARFAIQHFPAQRRLQTTLFQRRMHQRGFFT